jgi:hypothetical protein
VPGARGRPEASPGGVCAFDHAQHVWLAGTYNLRRIAWTPALRAYFSGNLVKVLQDRQGNALYVRRGLHPR